MSRLSRVRRRFAAPLGALALGLALLAGTPEAALARCTGIDLRDHLTATARSELDRQLARTPYAFGNHWVASRNGQRIDVIGTQHSGDSRMAALMREIRPLVRRADLVFLEVTEPQMRAADADEAAFERYFLLPPGRTLDRMMSADDWLLLSARLWQLGIEPFVAAQMQPWYLSDFLTGTDCRKRGFGSRRGLDDRIEQTAIAARVPTLGLEEPVAGLEALSGMALKDQVKLLLLDLKSQTRHEDLFVTLSEAYFDGRLTEGRILTAWMVYRDQPVSRAEVQRLLGGFDRRVLDQRNRAWVKRLAARPEPRLVVAVGAAHLAGENGVLNLLARAGYQLTPFEG